MAVEEKTEVVEVNPAPNADVKIETNELTETEQRAYSKGWRPEAEYEGDSWIDASEFMGRAPLYDGLSKQGKTIKQLQRTVTDLAEHNRKIEVNAIARAQAQLKEQKKAAYEESNFNEVVDIEERQRKLDVQAQNTAAKAEEAPNQDFVDWHDKNDWYGSNHDMTIWADGYGRNMRDINSEMPADELYALITEKAKEVFPQNFGGDKGLPNRGAPTTKSKSKRSTSGAGALTEEQERLCKEFVDAGVMTKEEYVEQIKAIEA